MHTKKFFPALRCLHPLKARGVDHAITNVRVAQECGADGVFLIGHDIPAALLCTIYEEVHRRFPKMWVGVKFLDLSEGQGIELFKMVERCSGLTGLWLDHTPSHSRLSLPVQVFGTVPLIHDQPSLGNPLSLACERVVRFADVATIQEDPAGTRPEIAKLEEMKKYLRGKIPLAYAGTMTEQNVDGFLPYIDSFLVEYGFFTPEVKVMSEKIHSYSA